MQQPKARVEVVRETHYGETVEDPYRWMENWHDSELSEWVEAQGAYTRGYLDALPDQDVLLRRITELSDVTPFATGFSLAAGRSFYLLRPPGANVARLVTHSTSDAPEHVIFDPGAIEGEVHSVIDWYRPSDDGRLVAFGLSEGGSEESVLHIIETDSDKMLPDTITRTRFGGVYWLPDNQSFLYHRLNLLPEGAPETDRYGNSRIYLHRLGDDPENDLPVFGNDINPHIQLHPNDFPFVAISDRSDWMLGVVVHGVMPELTLYAAPRAALSDPTTIPWRKVVDVEDEVVGSLEGGQLFALDGDMVYLRTYRDAPRYRVVALDLSNPSMAVARTVVPESEAVVEGIALAGSALLIAGQVRGIGHLRRLSLQDGSLEVVQLPVEGTITDWAAAEESGETLMQLSSWIVAPQIYRLAPDETATVDTGWLPATPIDFRDIESYETEYRSHDGTMVPISIIHRRGLEKNGTNPTILYAYGSYGISMYPYFQPTRLAWYERGGVFAVAHIRGGGENGREWHQTGYKLSKGTTIDDFIAAAEFLIHEGYTSAAYLAGQGGSAGGIPTGGSLVKRPDLWAVMLMHVAVTNFLRFEFSENGPPNIPEFGTITTEEGFRALQVVDSYTRIKDRVRYPACLITTGLNDPRVVVWQATKMAARLQAATSSGRPILLRVEKQAGHGMGSSRRQLDEEMADVLAFVLSQVPVTAIR